MSASTPFAHHCLLASPTMAHETSLHRMAKSPPLFEVYQWAVAAKSSCWPEVEDRFLSAMWRFDRPLTGGAGDKSDKQGGKEGFFADLTALLLENCSGKKLRGRKTANGLILPKHSLENSYSRKGTVEILIQTKIAGSPKPGRSTQRRTPTGRADGVDLDEWVKEAAFKAIDLKAKWAQSTVPDGGNPSDLLAWLHRSKPCVFLFLATRLVDRIDFDRALLSAESASRSVDGVGLVAYESNPSGDGYRACKVPPHLELDRVLSRVCTALRVLP